MRWRRAKQPVVQGTDDADARQGSKCLMVSLIRRLLVHFSCKAVGASDADCGECSSLGKVGKLVDREMEREKTRPVVYPYNNAVGWSCSSTWT